MAITVRATGVVGPSGGSSVDIEIPGDIVADDVMYVMVEKNSIANLGAGPTPPDDFDGLKVSTQGGPAAALFSKVLVQGDAGRTVSFSWVSGDDFKATAWGIFAGVEPTQPEDVPVTWRENYGDASQPIVCPGVTTVTDGCYLVAFGVTIGDIPDLGWSLPGGWTDLGHAFKVIIAGVTKATAGATGDISIGTRTGGGDPLPSQWVASLVALRPRPVPTTAPVNTALPQITGVIQTGQTVRAKPGSWDQQPVTAYAYRWLRDGSPISGETGSAYDLAPGDAGHEITLGVVATNSIGGSDETLSAPVDPLAPGTGADVLVRVNGAWLTRTSQVRTDGDWR